MTVLSLKKITNVNFIFPVYYKKDGKKIRKNCHDLCIKKKKRFGILLYASSNAL